MNLAEKIIILCKEINELDRRNFKEFDDLRDMPSVNLGRLVGLRNKMIIEKFRKAILKWLKTLANDVSSPGDAIKKFLKIQPLSTFESLEMSEKSSILSRAMNSPKISKSLKSQLQSAQKKGKITPELLKRAEDALDGSTMVQGNLPGESERSQKIALMAQLQSDIDDLKKEIKGDKQSLRKLPQIDRASRNLKMKGSEFQLKELQNQLKKLKDKK